ncbi:hypothetical protein D4764_12G0011000 [Takifugu flavidus]|uniref:Alkylated DNA repair protein AlkB homologue 8 N-terminal domain-containing protein n=1 Tax=Takifugu flavidus TaxID=433684 RepID=A0A5C6PHI1_9TELE|nr:hypothetical protein D4764_12G0011000 [Takifugu flavidus]
MALRDCFDTTDWDVLCEPHGEDIDGLTTCITDYINFCVENTVPTRKVRCFPNNKPWVTPDLKALLNEKKRVFRSGDKEELRRVQKELRRGIRRGKDSYRRKRGERLKGSNAREVWRGLKTISGHTKDSGRAPESGGLDWANELNSFFNRFDCAAPASPTHQSPDLTVLSHHHPPSPPSNPRPHPPGVTPRLSITADQVRKELRRTKTRKATGPDGINSRLLKDCADQLCGTAHAREPNHFRPVALTSHLMKTMERIVLTHLRQLVDSKMDPLQFAYQPGIGVDDAVIYLLNRHDLDSCHLQKFSDDTAIIGRVSEGDELEYREVITNFVTWCELNHLRINTSKTKEVVIDSGLDIEIVEEYKYLGVHLNNILDWTHNTDPLYKKGQSRLHLLRRLRSFGVCRSLLRTFYDSVVASVIFYAVVCWSCGSSERDRKRLNKLVRQAGSVLDCSLDSIEEVGERRMLAKLTSIMDTPSHPLHETVGALSSSFSSRLLHPRCKRERYRRSFIPTAVRLFNMHNT